MDLVPHLARMRRDLLTAADTGSDDAAAAAERLAALVEPSLRLLLLDVLVEAAGDLTRDLAPRGIEVRLRGRDIDLVVTPPPGEPTAPAPVADAAADSSDAEADGGTARLSLRLPERLKTKVDRAAEADGLSVNAWLVRVVGVAVDAPAATPAAPTEVLPGGRRHTGWVR